MYNEYEKRKRFLEFLEVNGLSYKKDKRVIEVAPDISLSISKLLMEKYAKLYKCFVVSKKFSYDNKFGIDGVRGDVNYFSRLSFDVPRTRLNDKNMPKKFFTGNYLFPKERDFDTLILYGLRRKMLEFNSWNIRRYFGEVFSGNMEEVQKDEEMYLYNAVMNCLNYKFYGQYQFIEEYDSKRNETYILIKNK